MSSSVMVTYCEETWRPERTTFASYLEGLVILVQGVVHWSQQQRGRALSAARLDAQLSRHCLVVLVTGRLASGGERDDRLGDNANSPTYIFNKPHPHAVYLPVRIGIE